MYELSTRPSEFHLLESRMYSLTTIPSLDQLEQVAGSLPSYVQPNTIPYAVVLHEFLSDHECDEIVYECEPIPTHSFHGCNAYTRDLPRPLSPSLQPILDALVFANETFFKYDINADEPAAWLQTYGKDNDYKTHADGSPAQSRKLTAVAMLTDRRDYAGGSLVFDVGQAQIAAPNARGTIIVFPAWVTHHVTPIDYGNRQTINLGVWGPPFK